MKDIKYIIKRIIIGVGIALAIMFIKENVYAYEWEAQGDQQLDFITNNNPEVSKYSIFTYFSSSPSYPKSFNSSFDMSANSSTFGLYISDLTDNRQVGAPMVTGITINFDSYVFEPDTNYYVIIPFGYNDNNFTSLSYNFNGYDLISSSTYSINKGSISSAVFSFGSDNDYELINNYSYLLYFKILFTVSEETNNVVITIGSTSTKTVTFTAFNTTSFKDYIWRYNLSCSSYSSSTCVSMNRSFLTPLLYTGTPGAPIIDGNDTLSDVTSDIKTQITNIINGVFDENLDFPYMNGGGRPFGDNEYTLQDLLIVPLNFAKSIAENYDTCVGVEIPIPGFNNTFTLPCISSFITEFAPDTFVTMVQTIFGCVISFNLLLGLYRDIQYALSPKDAMYLDSFI